MPFLLLGGFALVFLLAASKGGAVTAAIQSPNAVSATDAAAAVPSSVPPNVASSAAAALMYEQDPGKLLAFSDALAAAGTPVPALATRAAALQAILSSAS